MERITPINAHPNDVGSAILAKRTRFSSADHWIESLGCKKKNEQSILLIVEKSGATGNPVRSVRSESNT
jgi:hypothetical protein